MEVRFITDVAPSMLVDPDIHSGPLTVIAADGERLAAIYTRRGYPYAFAGLLPAEQVVALQWGGCDTAVWCGYQIVLTPVDAK